jgi:hypothetical protein
MAAFVAPLAQNIEAINARKSEIKNCRVVGILLVEDDKLIGDGIKAGLSKMGFSIDWFTAGLEGISTGSWRPLSRHSRRISRPSTPGRVRSRIAAS